MSSRTDALLEQIVQELSGMKDVSTAWAARFSGRSTNGVLEVATDVFDASGLIVRNYGATVGAVIVTNATGAAVTFQAGSPSGSTAPTKGAGVQIIPTGSWITIPVDNRAFVLYGTAGTSVSFQAFTGLHPYGIDQ